MNSSPERSKEPGALFERAIALHRSGDRSGARKLYRKLLRASPDNPQLLNLMGLAANQDGRPDEAREWVLKALEAQPDFAPALRNLGNLLVDARDFDGARQTYERALDLDPDDPTLHANLCVALRGDGDLAAAIDVGRRAVRLGPGHAIAQYSLANAYRAANKHRKAVRHYEETLRLDPAFSPARDGLCRCLLALESRSLLGRSKLPRTRAAYREWLEQEPKNPIPTFMLLALDGKRPERAPDEVVTEMFDRTADTFEEHLARLDYQAPALIEALLEDGLGAPAGQLDVLDGGCGTGLCGPFLRTRASRLVGVDLSAGMLRHARARGIYDELVQAELTAYLAEDPQRHDLAVFADTFCYFGGLDPLLQGAARVLRPGGALAFTVELATGDDESTDFRLHPHGRYSHGWSYVQGGLERAGFTVLKAFDAPLRSESGVPVQGLIVLAQRAGS